MSHDSALIMRQLSKEIDKAHDRRRRMARLGTYGMIAAGILGLATGLLIG